jgi:3-oxoacyl-(acyl-carrier-protein) synthase
MNEISVGATSFVTEADLPSARLGQRFGRLDSQSQLALLAVAELKINFSEFPPGRIGIVLDARVGSLTTDVNFWNGRTGVGGPSPTLFAYTLPSAAIGEIAICFKLTGPNLCVIGAGENLLREAADLIERGEADTCICVFCEVISNDLAKIISCPTAASAHAIFLKRGEGPAYGPEFNRDMKLFYALISQTKSAS